MSVRILEGLRRSLSADAEILEQESIIVWLMRFASGKPLVLHHPIMGDIIYAGIRFSGSVVPIFDRYVSLTIEDLIEKHLVQLEQALAEVKPDELERVGLAGAANLSGTRQRLLARASAIKARLLNAHSADVAGSPISAAGVLHVSVAARIAARISELRDKAPKKPKWAWLENFGKANPILWSVIGFVVGAIVTIVITFLRGK